MKIIVKALPWTSLRRLPTLTNIICPTRSRTSIILPIDYLMKRRITEAKSLTTSTPDFSPDPNCRADWLRLTALFFPKCFRKVEGTSPNEYRKSAKQKPAQGSQ